MQYVIQVLMDAGSWISPYVGELTQEWESAGHSVQIAHLPDQALPADFCFCLSFSRILPAAVRQQYKHTLVVHESDLPDGRGWAPMTWQILEGKNLIPVTLIEAVDAVDAGQIYLQEWIELDGTELNPEWRLLQARATQKLCMQWLQAYPSIVKKARQQTGPGSSYPRRRAEDSKLDPSRTLAEQFDLLRVVDNQNYPAFFEIRGRRYQISITAEDRTDK
ncbi:MULTISPECIES: formyltransferase family protein [unclassified Herbaspirillum]|uniref:formyltransferase family protein n=1 Tax=unclassified Herbaspirillum TaxID=2624150 RepID=UPI0011728D8F|nr:MULTISPECIES: formyltransferase family protein [unclassified Herbaspirillum]MBB5392531.1 methionyl-tRNA formyltransferase [Herbaspirillum sp. SJZ102]TQK06168.1 formyl transferase-like protein [Herbaspirillum sp. SJZ130]